MEDVKSHYDQDKDFFISVLDVYIVECVLNYFGMADTNGKPTKHIPPAFVNDQQKKEWFFDTIGEMVSQFVFSTEKGEKGGEPIEGIFQIKNHLHYYTFPLHTWEVTDMETMSRRQPPMSKMTRRSKIHI